MLPGSPLEVDIYPAVIASPPISSGSHRSHSPGSNNNKKITSRMNSSPLPPIPSTPMTTKRMIRCVMISFCFILTCWYFPRYLADIDDKIVQKVPPYQITSAGDVILNMELNHELVNPPTIPSAFLIYTSIFLPILLMVAHICANSITLPSTLPLHVNSNKNSSPPSTGTTSVAMSSSTSTSATTPTTSNAATNNAPTGSGGSPITSMASSKRATRHFIMELTTALSAFMMAIGVCESTTIFLKLYVQRRRPNFYNLCQFDTSVLQCTADIEHIKEANLSFPSGHSSLSCCGMTFLVLYFCGKYSKQQWKCFFCAIVPWGWTIFVGTSRIVDFWHHPSDVLAGLSLGFVTCSIVFHTWYPPIWSTYAGIPRAAINYSSSYLPSHHHHQSEYMYHKLSTLSD